MFLESGNKVGVKVVGFIKDFDNTNYNSVEFSVLHPDNEIENQAVKPAKWGYYSYEMNVTDKWKKGTYVISAKFDGEKIGHVYLQILDFDINWLKKHTEKWIDGEITQKEFFDVIRFVN
tara:strand:- start:341 stop:697 length:357 start_codon:yes stop_codon:yes gene_type:complete